MELSQATVYLAGCAARGVVPDLRLVAPSETEELLTFAGRHQLGAAVCGALLAAGKGNSSVRTTLMRAAGRGARQELAFREVTEKLEEAGIPYAPLKGIVLKRLYAEPAFREMSDCDILIDGSRREDARALMEGLGFSATDYGRSHHDIYHRAPGLSFELHSQLLPPFLNNRLYGGLAYYRDVWKRLVKDEGNAFGYHFSPEDFYLYLIAHAGMHYYGEGTGLRILVDICVFTGKHSPDPDYIRREAEKLGISAFERQLRSISGRTVNGEAPEAVDAATFRRLAECGSYGSSGQRLSLLLGEMEEAPGGRLSFLAGLAKVPFRRSDPRYEMFAERYPFFYRHRVLLPLLPLYRIMMVARNSPGWIKAALRSLFRRKKTGNRAPSQTEGKQ